MEQERKEKTTTREEKKGKRGKQAEAARNIKLEYYMVSSPGWEYYTYCLGEGEERTCVCVGVSD